jgi:hypothetical protein
LFFQASLRKEFPRDPVVVLVREAVSRLGLFYIQRGTETTTEMNGQPCGD